jgi:hypothetical protein
VGSNDIFVHVAITEPHEETVVGDSLPDACPKCSGGMYVGYGLAGGGMGAYAICLTDDCDDTIYKVLDSEDDDA